MAALGEPREQVEDELLAGRCLVDGERAEGEVLVTVIWGKQWRSAGTYAAHDPDSLWVATLVSVAPSKCTDPTSPRAC